MDRSAYPRRYPEQREAIRAWRTSRLRPLRLPRRPKGHVERWQGTVSLWQYPCTTTTLQMKRERTFRSSSSRFPLCVSADDSRGCDEALNDHCTSEADAGAVPGRMTAGGRLRPATPPFPTSLAAMPLVHARKNGRRARFAPLTSAILDV